MSFTIEFLSLYWQVIQLAAPLLLFLSCIIVACGQLVGRLESWNWFDALYWSCITALTVGYGDMRPTRRSTKLLSILVGLVGLIMTGLMISAAVHAASLALANFVQAQGMEAEVQQLRR